MPLYTPPVKPPLPLGGVWKKFESVVILVAEGIVPVEFTSFPRQAAAPMPDVNVPFTGLKLKTQLLISAKFSV